VRRRRWKVPALREVLAYRNREVVARFCKDYGIDERRAKVVFKDMLRFLWLSIVAQERSPRVAIGMFEAMSIVDEMWHTFVTFTRDYVDFSVRYFGHYVHHDPGKLLEKPRRGDDARNKTVSDATVELAWKELGPAVARRWFNEYRLAYPMVKIRSLQLAAARGRS